MNQHKTNKSNIPYIAALLIGIILFLSFGKNWLALESALVFLAGLLGVAVSVLLFGAWRIYYNSHHKEE